MTKKKKWLKRSALSISMALIFMFISSGLVNSNQNKSKTIPEERANQTLRGTSFRWLRTLLIGVGDSLTQGTRDAANNKINTENAYLQKVYKKLKKVAYLKFSQPWLNENENRINPFQIPTNLGVDGEDIFSLEGLEYGKRVGSNSNYESNEYYCNRLQPYLFADMHDKVLYPINLWAGKKVSQLDALIWHLNHRRGKPAWVIFWVGNNDAALASLGLGGKNPEYLPIPFDQIKDKLKWSARYLLNYGYNNGVLSFKPYTGDAIARNLTEVGDFNDQLNHIKERLANEANLDGVEFFLLNFPYYCEVGYLFDQSDLNYYLGRQGYPVENFNGRIPLLTFVCMYALLKSGETYRLNQILNNDALILDDSERGTIKGRINAFNEKVGSLLPNGHVHLIDIAKVLNGLFESGLTVNGKLITRHWGRGHGFSLDGVHASYTVHAHIANIILDKMNRVLNLRAPTYNLASVLTTDPYVDWDGDGWVKGPDYKASGRTKILFLFKDNDSYTGEDNKAVIDTMTADQVWQKISDALLEEIIDIPLIRMEAERLGLIPIK